LSGSASIAKSTLGQETLHWCFSILFVAQEHCGKSSHERDKADGQHPTQVVTSIVACHVIA
jgi:hypothetical protein